MGGVSVELVLVTSQVPHYKHACVPYLSSCPCFGEASPLLSCYLRVLGYCHSAEILQNPAVVDESAAAAGLLPAVSAGLSWAVPGAPGSVGGVPTPTMVLIKGRPSSVSPPWTASSSLLRNNFRHFAPNALRLELLGSSS